MNYLSGIGDNDTQVYGVYNIHPSMVQDLGSGGRWPNKFPRVAREMEVVSYGFGYWFIGAKPQADPFLSAISGQRIIRRLQKHCFSWL